MTLIVNMCACELQDENYGIASTPPHAFCAPVGTPATRGEDKDNLRHDASVHLTHRDAIATPRTPRTTRTTHASRAGATLGCFRAVGNKISGSEMDTRPMTAPILLEQSTDDAGWGRGGGRYNGKPMAMRPAVEGRMSRSVQRAISRRKTTLALQEQAMAGITCAA